MARFCRRYETHPPVCGLVLDGDECILWGRFLQDILARVPGDRFNWPLKKVELDGSVVDCSDRCLRMDLIDEYVASSYYIRFRNGAELALPHVPASEAPLPGLPHLIHRSGLRPEKRAETRMHTAEADWFKTQVDPELDRVAGEIDRERVAAHEKGTAGKIWLPVKDGEHAHRR
jgi:hypothetical protein